MRRGPVAEPTSWRYRRHLAIAIGVLLLAQLSAAATRDVADDRAAEPQPSTSIPAAPPQPLDPATSLAPPTTATLPPATPGTVARPPVAPSTTPPLPSPAPVVNGGACGPTMSKSNGDPWTCTFADDFNGSSLDRTKWQVIVTRTSGYHSGGECFVDHPDNIAVRDGTLLLTVIDTGASFYCESFLPVWSYISRVTSGMVSTQGRFSQTYGRFEARVKMPSARTQGLHTAIWLWPEDQNRYGSQWPASGEIDIAEWFSLYPDLAIPYLHYNGDNQNVTRNDCRIDRADQFHTYAVEWSATAIRFIYDGELCMENTTWTPSGGLRRPQPFDHPFAMLISPVLGVLQNYPPAGAPLYPATTTVDWVRIWR